MHSSKREKQEFGRILKAIADEKVRYFYMMLGEAIAEQSAPASVNDNVNANTSASHLAEITSRLNAG